MTSKHSPGWAALRLSCAGWCASAGLRGRGRRQRQEDLCELGVRKVLLERGCLTRILNNWEVLMWRIGGRALGGERRVIRGSEASAAGEMRWTGGTEVTEACAVGPPVGAWAPSSGEGGRAGYCGKAVGHECGAVVTGSVFPPLASLYGRKTLLCRMPCGGNAVAPRDTPLGLLLQPGGHGLDSMPQLGSPFLFGF